MNGVVYTSERINVTRCRRCKFYEQDSWAKIPGFPEPIIVAHDICSKWGDRKVIIFGEGYGNKIQAVGKYYLPDSVDFIAFDVLIGDNYQPRDNVEGIAQAFGVKTVPIVGIGPLEKAVEFVKVGYKSTLGNIEMEGVVCRPEVEVRDRAGNRLIVKIKRCDFREGA